MTKRPFNNISQISVQINTKRKAGYTVTYTESLLIQHCEHWQGPGQKWETKKKNRSRSQYNYKKYTHGEAVSMGICLAAKLAYKKRLIVKNDLNLITNLIADFGLPTRLTTKNKTGKIIKSMLLDKKIKDGKLRFVLPINHIGKVTILNNCSNNEIKNLINPSVN